MAGSAALYPMTSDRRSSATVISCTNRHTSTADRRLTTIVSLTFTRRMHSTKTNTTGSITTGERSNERNASETPRTTSAGMPSAGAAIRPAVTYSTQQAMKGTAPVPTMRVTFENRSVRVRFATSEALLDMGEHWSPMKLPLMMAPPTSMGLAPTELAMVMQMTPVVAEAANELPVSTDMTQHRRNVAGTSVAGVTIRTDQQVIAGMVPAARHEAVRAPMRAKSTNTDATSESPRADIRAKSPMS